MKVDIIRFGFVDGTYGAQDFVAQETGEYVDFDDYEDMRKERDALIAEREQLLAQMPLTTIQVLQGYPSVVSHSQCGVKDGFYKVYAQAVPAQQVHCEGTPFIPWSKAGEFVQPSPADAAQQDSWLINTARQCAEDCNNWPEWRKQAVINAMQQPSQAVAVPAEQIILDWLGRAKIEGKKNLYALKLCEIKQMLHEINCSHPSPRITEQDAREIVEHFVNQYSIVGYSEYIKGWMLHHCRSLLNKLNAKPESVGG